MWWGGGGSDPEPVEEVTYSSLYVLPSKFWEIEVVEKLVLQLFMFIRISRAKAQSHTLKIQASELLHKPIVHFSSRAPLMH